MKKKTIAMIIAMTMAFGCITGCGSTAPAAQPTEAAESSEDGPKMPWDNQ